MEYPSVCETRTVVARKWHQCCECGGHIGAGESYELTKGIWPTCNGPETFKTCLQCSELRREISGDYGWDDRPAFTELFEWCAEAGDEYLKRMITIMELRGAKVADWARERLEEDTE